MTSGENKIYRFIVEQKLDSIFSEAFEDRIVNRVVSEYGDIIKYGLEKVIEEQAKKAVELYDKYLQYQTQRDLDFRKMFEERGALPNLSFNFIVLDKHSGNAEEDLLTYLKTGGYKVGYFDWEFPAKDTKSYHKLLNEKRNGRPDLVYEIDGRLGFVEVKTGYDGLRVDQAKWIAHHPTYPVIVYFVYYENRVKE